MTALDFDSYFHALERVSTFVKIVRASPRGVDGDRLVLEVNGEWLFLIAFTAEARAQLQTELNRLAPVWVGRESEDAMPDILGYRKLERSVADSSDTGYK